MVEGCCDICSRYISTRKAEVTVSVASRRRSLGMVAVEASKGKRPSLGLGVGNVFPKKLAIMRVQAPMESILLSLMVW